jgi:putative colanic acid biosynthesis UDP-glucose lipid carrier transferase
LTRYSQYIKRINIFSDFIILNLCYIAMYYYKLEAYHPPFTFMLFYINFAWLFATSIIKPYDISRTSTFYIVLRSFLMLMAMHVLLVCAYYVFEQSQRYSREFLALFYLSVFVCMFVYRMIFHFAIKLARKRGMNYRNIVIITQKDNPVQVQDILDSRPEYGYRIRKIIDGSANLDELKQYCLSNNIHEIFYSISLVKHDTLAELMVFAEENLIRVRLIADFKWVTVRDLELEKIGTVPILKVHTTPLDNWDAQLIKRIFDIVFSSLVIAFLLSWLLPIIAIIIKLDSKGPAFFKQRRTGRDNQWFWCFKLRTMHLNDESDTLQATANDKRITRVGKFLRKSSLDELPQFFNVLIGDMSVVGPRPHMLKHTEDFSAELDNFMARHKIKPGITGLAQSKGYRGETSAFEMKKNRVKLDLFYINNWTFIFDLKIIFNTIISIIKQDSEPGKLLD